MKAWWLAHQLGADTRRGELLNLQAAEEQPDDADLRRLHEELSRMKRVEHG